MAKTPESVNGLQSKPKHNYVPFHSFLKNEEFTSKFQGSEFEDVPLVILRCPAVGSMGANCHSMDEESNETLVQSPSDALKQLYNKTETQEMVNSVNDVRSESDKAPLTDVKLCIFEECHANRKSEPESPLDPLKTRLLYSLLGLLAVWTIVYVFLLAFHVI